MPVYNGEKYLREAIDSLLMQDYKNYELIISDNASTDKTAEICSEYVKKDPRIRYYRNQKNMGGIYNGLRVIELAKREYFMLASCHDLWEPSFISHCMAVLRNNPSVGLCYASADWIDLTGKSQGSIFCNIDTRGLDRISRCHIVLWGLQYAYPMYGMMRTDIFRKVNLGQFRIGADTIILFELSFLTEFAQVPELLFHVRKMPDYGSWDTYIEKCLNRKVSGLERRFLYWDMIIGYFKAINRQMSSIPARVFLMFSTLLCLLVRYRWIKHGISKRKQGG